MFDEESKSHILPNLRRRLGSVIMCSYSMALENTIRRCHLSRYVGRGEIFLANDDIPDF